MLSEGSEIANHVIGRNIHANLAGRRANKIDDALLW